MADTSALDSRIHFIDDPIFRCAYWERHPVALRPDQLLNLANALNVSVEDLVGTNGMKKRGSGPTGKMKQLFEAASRLPRNQQQKLAAIIEPFIIHHAGR